MSEWTVVIYWHRDQRRREICESSFDLWECLFQRWSHSRWWQSSGCRIESNGWSSGEVIEDEKVKELRAKDFGLVILGPLTSPGMLVGRQWAKYQSLQCYIWGNWLRCQQTVAGSSQEAFYHLWDHYLRIIGRMDSFLTDAALKIVLVSQPLGKKQQYP